MFKRIVRPDGSVIFLVPKKDTQATTFEVLFKVGSRYETKVNNGVSHFLEHLVFKGTEARPTTAIITKELDGLGADYNAFTGKEHTGYYITTDSANISLIIEMLADILQHSKFDPVEMDRERGVIIEEINMYEDNPLMHIEDVFENLLFQGTTLGVSILGPKVNIKKLSRQALYSFYQKHYYNGNTIFLVGGRFKEKQVLSLINKYFPVSKKQARNKVKAISSSAQNIPRIKIIKRNLEQVQLILGFRNVASFDKKFLPSQLLVNILGGTMSSRLILELREKRGLCYFIRTASEGYEDTSSFLVHAGLNKNKIYEALEVIKEELTKIKIRGITREELKKAKANIRGRMILKLESTTSKLNFLAAQEMMNQPIKTVEQKLKELDKITLSQVNNMAKEIIQFQKANLAIIGPFSNKNKFLNILKK